MWDEQKGKREARALDELRKTHKIEKAMAMPQEHIPNKVAQIISDTKGINIKELWSSLGSLGNP